MDIEKSAYEYGEKIRQKLELEPIYRVNPNITANAHRMGYIAGATDMMREMAVKNLESELGATQWKSIAVACFSLMLFFIVLSILFVLS